MTKEFLFSYIYIYVRILLFSYVWKHKVQYQLELLASKHIFGTGCFNDYVLIYIFWSHVGCSWWGGRKFGKSSRLSSGLITCFCSTFQEFHVVMDFITLSKICYVSLVLFIYSFLQIRLRDYGVLDFDAGDARRQPPVDTTWQQVLDTSICIL